MTVLLCRESYMPVVIYTECHKYALHAEPHYAKCHSTRCSSAKLTTDVSLLPCSYYIKK